MHNIRAHTFYFWYTLYTQTPFLTVKPINPPFYHFSDHFKPTLSKAWVAHYVARGQASAIHNSHHPAWGPSQHTVQQTHFEWFVPLPEN